MKLNYEHWKAGDVSVEVHPMPHDKRYVRARSKVYFIDSDHQVYNAGGVDPDGTYRPSAHLHVGWNAVLEVTPIEAGQQA